MLNYGLCAKYAGMLVLFAGYPVVWLQPGDGCGITAGERPQKPGAKTWSCAA